MTGEAIPVESPPQVAPEDQARAEFYALLAQLWYAAPDAPLLQAIAASGDLLAEGAQTALADAWRGLKAAAAAADPEIVRGEYDAVFVGTGKAEIALYASGYLVDTARERVLVALRDELLELGLGRTGTTHEPEDHFAALFEIMRHLIVSSTGDAALQRERKFFTRYLARAYNLLVDAVATSARTDFYKFVARFTKAFCDVEASSFEML